MARATRGGNRDHTPNVRPVKRVELSEKNTKQRFIAVIVLLIIASCAFVYALNGLMSNDSGWTNIEASSSAEINCGDDFIFQYYIGAAGVNATTEKKALTLLYTESVVKAYQMFCNDESFEGITNVYDINEHPNEELTVDAVLYQALEQIVSSGRRELYLAPVYTEYDNLFFCNDDVETVSFDGYQNEEVASYFSEVASYANDPDMVNMELLGNNKVKLFVSDEYLAFAKENYISDYIDFSWMKNAFIADYLADTMISNGYTFGSITSYNGFTRNLDDGSVAGEQSGNTDREYSFNFYDRQKNIIYPAGVLNYTGSMSIVSMHNYPMSDKEKYDYYEFKNGEIRTRYVDVTDGLCKSAVNNMVCYSKEKSCAQILLEIIPLYVNDTLQKDAVASLSSDGIQSIYGMDGVLYYTDSAADITDLYEKENVKYTAELIK